MNQKNQNIFKLQNNYKYITTKLLHLDMKGCVVGMHNLKNKTIFDDVKVSIRFETPYPLFSDPVSSGGAKTIPTHDTILSITINDHDKHLMIITIPNNIPTSNWMPLEIHSSARWHPQTYIFIKSKYLYQLTNYSEGSSRTNQTFFFIIKYENSSPVPSDPMQSDDITILVMDNITLNINVDNEHSDLINITVLSTSLVRKLDAIGKTHLSPMASLNFHLYQIESFYFYGA